MGLSLSVDLIGIDPGPSAVAPCLGSGRSLLLVEVDVLKWVKPPFCADRRVSIGPREPTYLAHSSGALEEEPGTATTIKVSLPCKTVPRKMR
jgi:hypothetical protein